MANLFESVAGRLRGSSIVIWVFLASCMMLIIGLNNFLEDTLSSYYGVQMIEKGLNMTPASYPLTYWLMAIAPQVGLIVFFYLFLSETNENRWAFYASMGCFAIDFTTDIWYRSNGHLFSSWTVFVASGLLTFVYYTVGAQVFVTLGMGMALELFPYFIIQWKTVLNNIMDALTKPVAPSKHNQQPKSSGYAPPSREQDPEDIARQGIMTGMGRKDNRR